MRFILESDYSMQIKEEIIKLITSPTAWYLSPKLMRAEQTAIAQIRNYIAKRYDCDVIFTPVDLQEQNAVDTRDQFIVTMTIDIVLYHLYSQTGLRDIPQHRQQRYQDTLDWLKEVGGGNLIADLPQQISEDGSVFGNFIINSREQSNQKY
jgi:phage gp36-like protein